jgi:hypothetical protein
MDVSRQPASERLDLKTDPQWLHGEEGLPTYWKTDDSAGLQSIIELGILPKRPRWDRQPRDRLRNIRWNGRVGIVRHDSFVSAKCNGQNCFYCNYWRAKPGAFPGLGDSILIGDEGARSHTKSTHVAHGGAGPDPAVRRSGYLFSARSSRRGGLVVRSKR